VQEAVAASLLRAAREKQWLHAGAPRILVQAGETVAEGRPEIISTTLPAPGSAAHTERADAPQSTREPTMTLDSVPPTTPEPALPDPTAASSKRTHGLPEATRTSSRGLVAVPRQPDLRPEPTAAEVPAAAGEHRLHTADGEPDILVAEHPIVVGRSPECDVRIAYASASRQHLRLIPGAAGCRLEDLGSRHGTRVNGVVVRQPILLRAGDTVQIGAMGPRWTYEPSYRAVTQDPPPLREVR